MELQIGQVKLIYRNGGFSIIAPVGGHEIIVNIVPTHVDTDKAVVQLFVMPSKAKSPNAK